jgi:hypothetical protein
MKRDDCHQEAREACLKKVNANPKKMKAVVETGLEEMKARIDVFEEKFDKMYAARKVWLEKTEANIETGCSCTVQGTWSSKTRHERCCMQNP